MTARKEVGSVLTLVHLRGMLSVGPTRVPAVGAVTAIARAEAMTEKTKTIEECIAGEVGRLSLDRTKRLLGVRKLSERQRL